MSTTLANDDYVNTSWQKGRERESGHSHGIIALVERKYGGKDGQPSTSVHYCISLRTGVWRYLLVEVLE